MFKSKETKKKIKELADIKRQLINYYVEMNGNVPYRYEVIDLINNHRYMRSLYFNNQMSLKYCLEQANKFITKQLDERNLICKEELKNMSTDEILNLINFLRNK